MGLTEIYATFSYTMTHEEFQDFINPDNEVGQLLQAHFIAVQLLLVPITINELGPRRPEALSYGHSGWLNVILGKIPRHMVKYYAWPLSASKLLQEGSFYQELILGSRTMSPEPEGTSKTIAEMDIIEELSN